MKKLKVSSIFKKPWGLKGSDRVLVAEARVANAFEMFIKADEELTNANGELLSVINEEQARLEAAQKTLGHAYDNIQANNALKARLSEFIPK
jgi:elongation factor P--beta-lysine ligase